MLAAAILNPMADGKEALNGHTSGLKKKQVGPGKVWLTSISTYKVPTGIMANLYYKIGGQNLAAVE